MDKIARRPLIHGLAFRLGIVELARAFFALSLLVSLAGQSVAHAAHMAGAQAASMAAPSSGATDAAHHRHHDQRHQDHHRLADAGGAPAHGDGPAQPCAWCDRAGGCAGVILAPFTEAVAPGFGRAAPRQTDPAMPSGRICDFTERPPRPILT